MTTVSRERLLAERKKWRSDHPTGFFARPRVNPDNSHDLHNWECGIPGKKDTIWEGGVYRLQISFPQEYPQKPPRCGFAAGFYHPNIYPSGNVCLSILNEDKDWRPAISVKELLLGIQDLLDAPNPEDPAQKEALDDFTNRHEVYQQKVKEQAIKYHPPRD